MTSAGIIKEVNGRYERIPEIPAMCISTNADDFVHESQHCEFVKNKQIIKRFVQIWNQQTNLEMKQKLIKTA